MNGRFQGSWFGAGGVTMVLGQSGSSVQGSARWSGYTCSSGAFFSGTLTGDSLVGTLTSILPTHANFDLALTLSGTSLDGVYTITQAGPSCMVGEMGAVSLSQVNPASAAVPDGPREVLIFNVPADGETELLLHYRRDQNE